MSLLSFYILSLIQLQYAWGQGNTTDSIKIYPLDQVVITATRSPISIYDSPSQIDIFDSKELQNSTAGDMADLMKHSSSIYLNEFGGAAALKTASLRGSASHHLLVLVDGIRFNSYQNGVAYLNFLQLNNIEQVEIVHGGNSALYGSDAIGGVVNIITRRPSGKFKIRTEGSLGSFGSRRYLIESQFRISGLGLLAGYADDEGRDDYPFKLRRNLLSDTLMDRSNSDYQYKQIYLNANYISPDNVSLGFSARFFNAKFGVPGSLKYPSEYARQNDDELDILIDYHDMRIGGIEFILNSGFRNNLERYNNPDYFFQQHDYYRNGYYNLSPQINFKLSNSQRLIIGGEMGEGTLYSNQFDPRIVRVQKAVYLSGESLFEFDRQMFDKLFIYQSIRYDNISDVDFALTPRIGFNLRICREGDFRLRTSLGQNFSSPTFNDLYYRGYNNPDLKPEHSTSYDAGIITDFTFFGEQSAELTYFYLWTTDRISYNLIKSYPENIGKTLSDGIEVKYNGRFLNRVINLNIDYSFTNARKKNKDYPTDSTYNKQIKDIPMGVLNVILGFNTDPVSVSLNHRYVSRRFTDMYNSASLPRYNVTNFNISWQLVMKEWNFIIKCEIINIFDESYQVLKDYPMPGRSYRATLGIEY